MDRWENIKTKTKSFHQLVYRWAATIGKDLHLDDIHKEGVCKIIGFKTNDIKDQTPKKKSIIDNNQGVIGCWLSHKRLLTHLSKQNLPTHYAHMITEDDIDFPENLI